MRVDMTGIRARMNQIRRGVPEMVRSREASQGGPMRLPIDTSRLQFLVVSEAERLLRFEEGKPRDAWAPRVDENGEVLSRVQVVALGDGQAEIIRVSVPGRPRHDRAGLGAQADGRQ